MHYAARLAAARKQGLTQREIATAGGLTGQNAISKLLSNDNQGPTVDTFVRAVQGLGLTLAGFFEEMEQQGSTHADRPLPAPPSAILAQLDPDAVDAIVTKHFTSLGPTPATCS
jgi:transcriptional regulator with XRE-family HTH domain